MVEGVEGIIRSNKAGKETEDSMVQEGGWQYHTGGAGVIEVWFMEVDGTASQLTTAEFRSLGQMDTQAFISAVSPTFKARYLVAMIVDGANRTSICINRHELQHTTAYYRVREHSTHTHTHTVMKTSSNTEYYSHPVILSITCTR